VTLPIAERNIYPTILLIHQIPELPISADIVPHPDHPQIMFTDEFARVNMVCIVENIFEDGEWAILEWKDPNGLRGCGFFHIIDDLIVFQRGYWDRLSFLRSHRLPMPRE
jgi:hypothetical protein